MQFKYSAIITLGIAIFSMFFGAGNVIFPLALGVNCAQYFTFSFMGLILTSIGAPLLGLYGALLFEGDLKQFFSPLGKHLGIMMILLLVIALGPFGAMSRCLTLTYSALMPIFPTLSLCSFTMISVVIILMVILKRKFLLPILGKCLSPILLGMIFAIVIKGVTNFDSTSYSSLTGTQAFYLGFKEGYQTMDLLSAILFATTIWRLIKDNFISTKTDKVNHFVYGNCIRASLIAGSLLALIYIGLGFAAKSNAHLLQGISNDQMLGTLSFALLGPKWGIIANITIALACFTTIISLGVAAVDILWQTFNTNSWLKDKENGFYSIGIIAITMTTAIFANVGFENIAKVISPIVNICYPALITLTICNILNKKWGIKTFKAPTFGVLGVTILSKLF